MQMATATDVGSTTDPLTPPHDLKSNSQHHQTQPGMAAAVRGEAVAGKWALQRHRGVGRLNSLHGTQKRYGRQTDSFALAKD
jgi:hypothetical protein